MRRQVSARPTAVSFEAHRRGQEVDLHALDFGGLHFLHQARHFLAAAAVKDAHVARAEPHGRPRAVDGGVAAANDDHIGCQAQADFPSATFSSNSTPAIASSSPSQRKSLRALRADGYKDGVVTRGAIRPA